MPSLSTTSVPSGEARARIARDLFGRIAPRYDLANHVLSGGMDILWRRRAAAEVDPRPGERVLDLCTGTGDLARALFHRSGRQAVIHGADFSLPMLEISREKHARHGEPARLAVADGLSLPFRDESFDVAIASFGVRSFADLDAGLGEMVRVTRSGGRVAILEFSRPVAGLFRPVYDFYLRHLLPVLGDLVSSSPGTYAYLPGTVVEFPDQDAFAARLSACGLTRVRYLNFTFGVAALHLGVRP